MIYRILADGVLLVHFGFVLFVLFGGVLLVHWPKLAIIHLPAVLWGVLIEWRSGICPLTPLEQHLRRQGGEVGYTGGFVEHYVTAALYPNGLTPAIQVVLGSGLFVLNVVLYWRAWRSRAA